MKFARSMILSMALAAGTMVGGTAFAAPTDEQVDAAIAKFKEAVRPKFGDNGPLPVDQAARREAIKAAMEGIDFKDLTLAQIRKLNTERVLGSLPEQRNAIHDRLAALGAAKDADGAEATLMAIDFTPFPEKQDEQGFKMMRRAAADALAEATKHPAFADAIKGELGPKFISILTRLEPEDVAGRNIWSSVEQAIPATGDARTASAVAGVIDLVADPESKVDAAQLETIRTKLVHLVDASKQALVTSDVSDPNPDVAKRKAAMRDQRVKSFDGVLSRLNGAFAKGLLVGHKAPALTFTWSNTEKPISSLDDFKGKVVVLDFWATWCGPCRGSFPQVRDLKAHYAGYPVEIVGVTSIQGSHTKATLNDPKTEKIDCKDNPAKEKELMTEFIKDMNMTWTVAFAEQNVFNPEYGISGIPHVVIIDPNGVVRHRGLHPASDPVKKHEMIDSILKEFKLECPAADTKKEEAKEPAKQGG